MPWQDFVKRFLKKKVISEDILVAGYLNSKFISSSTPVLLLRCNSFIQSFSWVVKVSYNTGLRLVLVSRPVQLSTLREKCPYSEFFWSVFFHIRTEYGEIFHISSYSIWVRENAEQKSSEYGPFLRSARGIEMEHWTKTYKGYLFIWSLP